MFEVGRVCMKIAGRDAGKIGIVIEKIDDNYVLIDGETRRRKCNINHLEILDKTVKIAKGASNADVVKALKDLDIEVTEKKEGDKKEQTTRQKKQKVNHKTDKPKVEAKKETKPVKKAPAEKPKVEDTPKPEVKEEAPKTETPKEEKTE